MSEDQPVISPMMRDGSPADPEKFGVVAIDFQTTEQAIVEAGANVVQRLECLEYDMRRVRDEALLDLAKGRADLNLLCGAASFTVPIEQEIQTNANVAPRVTLEEMSGIFDSANNGKFRVPMQDGALASVSFWWSDFRNKLEAMISDDCHGLRVFQLRRIDADSPLELTRQEVCDGMAEGLTKLVEGYALKEKLADSAPK
jgi:hypothetical protein